MKLLLLLPALLYLGLLILNLGIFSASHEINFFWIARFEISVILFSTIFFILYIILLWVGFQFLGIFKDAQARKLQDENYKLKEELLSKQGELVGEIESRFTETLTKLQDSADKKLELYKKENEKVVTNMNYDIKNLGEKIERLKK
ncbi:hypothetical protein LAT59_04480 [Candidatus Gracilibacteria bacterium]|nr:hypothetical protein [Candidatus Gracilibacteria bacterium]